MNNRQVAQLFVAGGRSGKGSNFFIEGDTLYSYGYHFKVAVRQPDGTILVNSRKYSPSTTRHQSHLRNAIKGEIKYAVL